MIFAGRCKGIRTVITEFWLHKLEFGGDLFSELIKMKL